MVLMRLTFHEDFVQSVSLKVLKNDEVKEVLSISVMMIMMGRLMSNKLLLEIPWESYLWITEKVSRSGWWKNCMLQNSAAESLLNKTRQDKTELNHYHRSIRETARKTSMSCLWVTSTAFLSEEESCSVRHDILPATNRIGKERREGTFHDAWKRYKRQRRDASPMRGRPTQQEKAQDRSKKSHTEKTLEGEREE